MTDTSHSSPTYLDCADSVAVRMQDTLLLIGRIMIGWIFLTAGWGKVTNVSGFAAGMPKMGLPEFMGDVAAYGEFLGGILLIVGLASRYAAALLVIFTLSATFLAHRYWEYPPEAQGAQSGQFWKNIAITGGFLAYFVTGAGRYSLDAILKRKA